MTNQTLPRPRGDEYNEYYARYVGIVPDGDIIETLEREGAATQALLASVPPEKEGFRYAPGKWSVREVVGHLVDVERLFSFRALCFAREGAGELPGMDQEAWARSSRAGSRPLAELAEEWAALRRANVLFFGSLSAEEGERNGVASGFEVSVRALAWMMAGHELYHRRLLLRDYFGRNL